MFYWNFHSGVFHPIVISLDLVFVITKKFENDGTRDSVTIYYIQLNVSEFFWQF